MFNFSLANYAKTLATKVSKREFLNQIANMRTGLDGATTRNYELAKGVFNKDFASQEMKTKNTSFLKAFPNKRYVDFIDGIHHILTIMQLNVNELERISEKLLIADVSGSGITYLKTNLIRYAELMDFTIRYSEGLLPIVLYYEAQARKARTQNEPTKRDFKYIEDNWKNFLAALEIMSVPSIELKKYLSSIPDVTVPEDAEAAAAVENKLERAGDPLGMRFLLDSSTFNLFFHINNLIDNFLQWRYDRAVETREMVELKIEDYKRALENNPDPKMQQIIEAYEKRLAVLDARIKSEEEKYA